jgi:AcrR family transcriptional regulator
MDGSRFAVYKLPPGRHGLSRQRVAESQRWRLLGAAAELLAESGYRGLTTHRIAARAAVSFHTFYVHFGGLNDCLRAAFETAAKVVGESGGVAGAVELLAGDPSLAAVFGLETRAAVPEVAAVFAGFAGSFAPELREQLVLGAALALISDRARADGAVRGDSAGQVAALVGLINSGPACELGADERQC